MMMMMMMMMIIIIIIMNNNNSVSYDSTVFIGNMCDASGSSFTDPQIRFHKGCLLIGKVEGVEDKQVSHTQRHHNRSNGPD
jgi:hypothetical protein